MSVNTLVRMTPENIASLIENEKNEAISLAENNTDFIRKIQTYETTKAPYPDDNERAAYEDVLENNPQYSIQNMVSQEYLIDRRRNRLVDQLFIDIMNKAIDNGVYDNIEIGLSDYARFILYIDDYLHKLGNPAIIKESIVSSLVNRANMFIRQGQESLTPRDDKYNIYVQLPDEKDCKGIDPITSQKIITGFRLDADNRRVCYDISTIVKIVNSTFGLNTPVSPYTRAPFTENDMRRIKGFIKNMSSTRPVTRRMTRCRDGGRSKIKHNKKHKTNKKYNNKKKVSNKKSYRKNIKHRN